MKPKAISFDMDETLVEPQLVDKFWFEEVPKLYADKNDLEFEAAVDFVKEKYDEIGPEKVRWYQPEYWFERFDLEGDPSEVIKNNSYEVRIYPDALEILEDLYGDYELMVISNASQIFLDVQLDSIKGYFSRIFSCVSDFGKVKKNREVYEEICSLVGMEPEDLVHVGNDRKFDYEVPREIGIRAFLIDREGNDRADGEILRDLREIKGEL
ncbi:hypothetical protein AKJ65_01375 [candidate division MSBL1 archaeon SCGC-AAA259E19]|uniref:HAD family hydrolase n=1 Tax=candidate division MSBL1 archaeon SCGC-AAA259E19 TaxID=1698264 RepID=A0A133UN46_9EURY|nr:hypothetical protein AKJ65_01375 [candidate division MSBL1 archaeon SCGC-AAA259E19]